MIKKVLESMARNIDTMERANKDYYKEMITKFVS